GLLTNDVKGLAPGRWWRASALALKGKLVAELELFNRGEDFFLETDSVSIDSLSTALLKFKVIEDVKLTPLTNHAVISLWGANAASLLKPHMETLPAAWEFKEPVAFGDWPLKEYQLLVPKTDVSRWTEGWPSPMAPEAFESLRIEAGIPKW